MSASCPRAWTPRKDKSLEFINKGVGEGVMAWAARATPAKSVGPQPQPPSALISLRGIAKRYSNGTTAVTGLDLDLHWGEFVSLLGPSGCGKVHGAAHDRGAGRAHRRQRRMVDRARRARPVVARCRLRLPGSDFHALGDSATELDAPPLTLKKVAGREAARRAEAALAAVGLDLLVAPIRANCRAA